MAELKNRDETEDGLLVALLALFGRYVKHDDDAENELRNLLIYWLGLIFVRSAIQHGADRETAELAASSWVLGHTVRVTSQMRRHSSELQTDGQPVFSDARAKRIASTEVTEAASAGSEFAAELLGNKSDQDTWYTRLDERVCPYCGPLHGQPRGRWLDIYYNQILPVNPQLSIYGPPRRTPAHVNCRCFIRYISGAGDAEN